jgi:hypothetical protein
MFQIGKFPSTLKIVWKPVHLLCFKHLSSNLPINNIQSTQAVNFDMLSGLTFLQLKAIVKSVGLPANQKKDKLLKLLTSHLTSCPSDIPESFESDIAAQLKKNQDAKIELSQVSFVERDFDEEHEAEILARTICKFQPGVEAEQLDYALSYPGLQIMGRGIGLKSNSKRVILLKQVNAYCDCMLDHIHYRGGLKDLILPQIQDTVYRRPPSISGRIPKPSKITEPIDPELAKLKATSAKDLRKTALKMKLKVGHRKQEVIDALRDRRQREMDGEVFQYGADGRILSATELENKAEEDSQREFKLEKFGKFVRTRHLKGPVSDANGGYRPERILTVINHLQNRGTLPREVVMDILRDALTQHRSLNNVLSLSRPRMMDGTVGSLTVCGDLFGDLENLLHIFSDRVGNFPSPQNPYVFTGNIVDKGAQSFEALISLLLLKLSAPDSVHLLRGVHETTAMNSKFGFEEQILRLYDAEVLAQFRALFCALPVAAVLDRKVFVVHSGVGRETSNMTLAQMNDVIQRNEEPGEYGPLSELLWTGSFGD